MRRTFSVLALALCIAGCTSSGTKLDQSRVSEIQKGVTTRAEVEAKLGPPDYVAMMPDGRRQLVYNHSETSLSAGSFIPFANTFTSGGNTRRQTLQILINKDNIVDDYEFSDKTGEFTSGPFGHSSETNTPQGEK
jgi:outer membrane protein assembly factor BamE (lipoprotein component of BamABCDE complex)